MQRPIHHVTATTFKILLGLLLPTLVAMALIDGQLRTAVTPHGIVSFEFCGFTASCHNALLAWGSQGREFAMLSVGLDFLFMLLYSSSIAVALWLTAQTQPAKLAKILIALGWLALAMVVFDGIETALLGAVIITNTGSANAAPIGPIAGVAATIKFAILFITLPTALLAPLWQKFRR